MGLDKHHRPVLVPSGLQIEGASTFKANIVMSTGAGFVDHVQSLTGGSTGTQITNYGITKIVVTTGEGTAANLIYTIASPVAGVRKTVIADLNSTKLVTVRTATSTETFFGTTKNSFVFSTGSTFPPTNVELMGVTTAQWAILDMRTPGTTAAKAVTIAGATA